MKEWFCRCVEKWKRRHGWEDCPSCGECVRPRWVKDCVVFEDEPPLFFHYECQKCGYSTGINPTSLTDSAVRSLGFKDFSEYADKVINE